MKKSLIYLSVFSILIISLLSAKHFWAGETLSVSQVEKKWGCATALDEKKFLTSDDSTKASMTCSVLKQKKKYI